MRLHVAEVLVAPDRGQRIARQSVLEEVAERSDREGVSVEEDQHVARIGLLGDQVGERVQLLRVRQRP